MKYLCSLFLFCAFSCVDSKVREMEMFIKEWKGKEISFPEGLVTINRDSTSLNEVLNADYKIVTYIDSTGCVSCKLNLYMWNLFKKDVQTLAHKDVSLLFYFCPKDIEELRFLMKRDNFYYPAYIDDKGQFYQLNKIHPDEAFHTFLLDKDNKVLAIGNPVLNPKVKDLYLKIIQGKPVGEEEERERVETTVSVSSSTLSMGEFPYREAPSGTFTFTNTGKELWVIQDVVTSCGCLTAEYPKEPVRPGGQAVLRVTYRADHPGYFDKTLTVYSNAEDSPFRLRVTGSAVE